ncbi:MAG TPA: tryptophan synthase subunit alpha [Tepidiformaceae bacterium]|nr:tryptophan synthase subunit alpha [Tepidiformaceae bacterium]
MSQRLRQLFEQRRAAHQPVFIPYVTAGYPRRADCVPILLAMEAGGADVIEIGVPFSDPLADGATVQAANEVALRSGITFHDCCSFVREARAQGLQAPVLFMGYYNPLLALGDDASVSAAAAAGADGFIVVDLPPEEAGSFLAACRKYDMSFVPLVTPTTTDARIELVTKVADAFVYCVSVTGVTGQRGQLDPGLADFISRVRKHTSLPLAVGFGISSRGHVEAVNKIADAAVIGSAIIATIDAAQEGNRAERIREFVEDVSGH